MPPRDRALRIALAASILLNLFALGAAGGAAVVWTRIAHAPPVLRRRPLRAAAEGLRPDDQVRYLAALRDASKDEHPIQQVARENRRAAAELFVQPNFDRVAVTAALDRARAADFALRTRLEATIVAFAAGLPQAERASLAQGLARGGPLRQPRAAPGSVASAKAR